MRMSEHDPSQAVPPAESDWGSRNHVQSLLFIAATAVGIYLCYQLALPFLPPLVWALALAVLFTPFHQRLESRLKHPSLAAAVSVLAVGIIVALPAIFVGQRLIMESARGAEMINTKVESGEWRRAIEAQPRFAPLAGWIERKMDLPRTVRDLTSWLTTSAGSIVKGSLIQLISFCLTLYLLFYFLRDRRAALHSLRFLSPLAKGEMEGLFVRVTDSIVATVYGTLAVSAVQGFLGGLMFWWLGLPAPLLWGVVMGLLAVVPVLGAFVVWIPTALFLVLEGSWGKALILALWGGVVVAGIDNLLYPILVGNRLKMHTVLAFISVGGGLMLFGPSGLILGPVTLAITTVLLEVWRNRTAVDTVARTEPDEFSKSEAKRRVKDPESRIRVPHPPVPARVESQPGDAASKKPSRTKP